MRTRTSTSTRTGTRTGTGTSRGAAGGRARCGLDESDRRRGDEVEKFLARGGVVAEDAADGAGDDAGFVGADAAGGHAEVKALDVGGGAAALELLVEDAGEVVGEILLEHGAAGEDGAEAGEFADAEDFFAGDVRDADSVDDGEQMVRAEAEGDVLLGDDHLVVARGKCAREHLGDFLVDGLAGAGHFAECAGGAIAGLGEVDVGGGVVAEVV